jgi:hypothetical protein
MRVDDELLGEREAGGQQAARFVGRHGLERRTVGAQDLRAPRSACVQNLGVEQAMGPEHRLEVAVRVEQVGPEAEHRGELRCTLGDRYVREPRAHVNTFPITGP